MCFLPVFHYLHLQFPMLTVVVATNGDDGNVEVRRSFLCPSFFFYFFVYYQTISTSIANNSSWQVLLTASNFSSRASFVLGSTSDSSKLKTARDVFLDVPRLSKIARAHSSPIPHHRISNLRMDEFSLIACEKSTAPRRPTCGE